MTILISDIMAKCITKNKAIFCMIKGLMNQKNITVLSLCSSNNLASIYIELQEDLDTPQSWREIFTHCFI